MWSDFILNRHILASGTVSFRVFINQIGSTSFLVLLHFMFEVTSSSADIFSCSRCSFWVIPLSFHASWETLQHASPALPGMPWAVLYIQRDTHERMASLPGAKQPQLAPFEFLGTRSCRDPLHNVVRHLH